MRTALTRTLVAAFWMTTALYALLSASPFASQQFLQPRLVPAIAAFAVWHAPLSLGVLVIVMVGLLPYLRSGDRVVWAFSGMWLGTALLEVMSGGLASLTAFLHRRRRRSRRVDAAGVARAARSRRAEHGRRDPVGDGPSALSDFGACAAAAIVVTLTQAVLTLSVSPSLAQWSAGVARSLILHLAIFSAMFAVISIVRGLARPSPRPGAVETWLARIVVAAAAGLFVDRIILAALALTGPVAILLRSRSAQPAR